MKEKGWGNQSDAIWRFVMRESKLLEESRRDIVESLKSVVSLLKGE